VRHTDCTLTRVFRARFTFSRMSVAEAVQMKGLGSWPRSNRLALLNSHISARCRVLLGNRRTDHTPNVIYGTGTQPHCPVQHSLPVTAAHAPCTGRDILDSSRPHFRFQPSIPSALPSVTGSWNLTIHRSIDSHWLPSHRRSPVIHPVQSGLRTSELLHTRAASLPQSHPKADRGNDPHT